MSLELLFNLQIVNCTRNIQWFLFRLLSSELFWLQNQTSPLTGHYMVEYFSRFWAENEIQKTNEKHSTVASSNVFRNIAMNIEITFFSLNLTFFAIKFTLSGDKIFPNNTQMMLSNRDFDSKFSIMVKIRWKWRFRSFQTKISKSKFGVKYQKLISSFRHFVISWVISNKNYLISVAWKFYSKSLQITWRHL